MLLYVAGPYSALGDEAKLDNVATATEIAAKLWDMGHHAICPHKNTENFEHICKKARYDDFLEGDFNMISRCDGIVMAPRWKESPGAKREHSYALEAGVPIYCYPGDIPPLHPTELKAPVQVRRFRELLGAMYRMHLDKNADYSPNNILGPGIPGLMTRIWDKTARLMNLLGFDFQVTGLGTYSAGKAPKYEAIDDTFIDLANYAVIGRIALEDKWGK